MIISRKPLLCALTATFASLMTLAEAESAPLAGNAILVQAQDGMLIAEPAAAALLAKARDVGRVRVIARLDIQLRFDDGMSAAATAAQAAALGRAQSGVVERVLGGDASEAVTFDYSPLVSLWVNAAQLERLFADPAVIAVQEDVPAAPSLNNSRGIINATKLANQKNVKGNGQVVAILDTGVDLDHAMINGKIVSEACYSTTGGGGTSVCPGGVAETTAAGSGNHCNLAVSGCDHGTHVAAIAAGKSGALKGIAMNSKIIAIQVFSRFDLQTDCGTTPAPCVRTFNTDQIKGLERVFALRNAHKIAAINMSLGGGSHSVPCIGDSRESIIQQLREIASIATLIASGNNGFNGFISAPACVHGAVAVGSTNKDDSISIFSNHSPFAHLLAPGGLIKAAKAGGGTTIKSGTSMATPHAAGAFALLRSARNGASVSKILNALVCAGKPVTRAAPNVLYRPRIDVWKTFKELKANDPTKNFLFSNNADGNKWQKALGNWQVASGNFRVRNFNGWIAAIFGYCSHSFEVKARIKRIDPDATTPWNTGFMLASDARKNGGVSRGSGYWFAYNNAKNVVGNAVVWRLNNFNLSNNSGGAQQICNVNKNTATGKYHVLRVTYKNGIMKFFIDGSLICTVKDYSYVPTKIALMAAAAAAGDGHKVFYDYVKIKPLGSSSPASISTVAAAPSTQVAEAADVSATPAGTGLAGQ